MRNHARVLLGLFLAVLSLAAPAQSYPTKPVHVIVPYTSGSPVEAEMRAFAQFLEPRFKQPIVIENKPGAGTAIGAEAVARAPADGYTLLFTGASITSLKFLQKNVNFDLLRDLVPVTKVNENNTVLVTNKDVPAKTWNEFVALAKARPGTLNYASLGGLQLLAMEAVKKAAGIEIVEVRYGGMGAYIPALMGNNVQLAWASSGPLKGQVDSGALKILMVIGESPVPGMPDVPTSASLGYRGVPSFGWYGIFAPAGTPQAIVDRIAAEAASYVATPELKARATASHLTVGTASPSELRRIVEESTRIWGDLARTLNIQPQ